MSTPKRIFVLAAIGLLTFIVWHIGTRFAQFHASLTEIRGVKISDSREEVLYRLGTPSHVIDPEIINTPEALGYQRVYTVGAKSDDANRLPEGKRIADFLEWQYETPGDPSRLTVAFDSDGLVQSLSIFCAEARHACWTPIAGIESAADEEEVLRLGAPQVTKVESATKTVRFEDIGVTVYLAKGRTYMVVITGPQQAGTSHLVRFLRSLL